MSIFKKFQEKAQGISDNLQKQKEKLESDWFLEEQEKEKLSQQTAKHYGDGGNPFCTDIDFCFDLINDTAKVGKAIVRKMR